MHERFPDADPLETQAHCFGDQTGPEFVGVDANVGGPSELVRRGVHAAHFRVVLRRPVTRMDDQGPAEALPELVEPQRILPA
jgi:hypothetical protein